MLKLEQAPTFWFPVKISLPGRAEPVEIECEGNWFSRTALVEFTTTAATRTDLETCGAVLVGWKHVDAPYSRDALARLLEMSPRAGLDIYEAWLGQYFEARRKN